MSPVPRRGNSLQRDRLSKLLKCLEDLDNNAWDDPGSKVPQSVVRANLEAKIKVLRDKGVEPSEAGSMAFNIAQRDKAA